MSLVALLCIFSGISMSFLRYGLHACIQYSKWGLTIALYRGTIKLFSLYIIFLRIIPRTWNGRKESKYEWHNKIQLVINTLKSNIMIVTTMQSDILANVPGIEIVLGDDRYTTHMSRLPRRQIWQVNAVWKKFFYLHALAVHNLMYSWNVTIVSNHASRDI